MEMQTMSNPQENVIPANVGPTGSKHQNNTSHARSVKEVQEGAKPRLGMTNALSEVLI
jgi:hypothetical protein